MLGIGTAALDSTGTASLILNGLAAGSHNQTATYSGDLNFKDIASVVVAETVQDFQIVLDGSSGTHISAAALRGAVATYQVQSAPVNGSTFVGNVTLSLAGLTIGATYTISPASINVGSSTQVINVETHQLRFAVGCRCRT